VSLSRELTPPLPRLVGYTSTPPVGSSERFHALFLTGYFALSTDLPFIRLTLFTQAANPCY